MRLLFIANLRSPSASGRQRLWALRHHAENVATIDTNSYRPAYPALSGKIAKLCRRPDWLSNGRSLLESIVGACKKEQPDVIWIEWPREFTASAVKAIRNAAPSAKLVSFQDDNPWGTRLGDAWMWKLYFATVPLFDIHLVKRVPDIDNLTRLGAAKCVLWCHGMYPPLFHPPSDDMRRDLPVVMIATCMDERGAFVGRLLDAGVPLRVFGNRWAKLTRLPQRYPEAFSGAVEGEAYAQVLQRAKIGIGIVSSSNCDEWTMRSYEIPSCGAAFLGARTPAHTEMYEEGKEAEFFADADECLAKVSRLLRDEPHRHAIALAGHHRCAAMGTLAERAGEVLEQINRR